MFIYTAKIYLECSKVELYKIKNSISKDITKVNIYSKIKWSGNTEIKIKQEKYLSNMLNIFRDNKSSKGTTTFSFSSIEVCERYIRLLFNVDED